MKMNAEMVKEFKVNGLYSMKSICNQDCVWQYIVTARTACTVTLKSVEGKEDKVIKCRINKKATEYLKAETVYPLGQYSMAPSLSAY